MDDTSREVTFLEDRDDKEYASESTEQETLSTLVAEIEEKYQRASDARQETEQRWLTAWRNFRGMYGPEVEFHENEKSRAFVKITKTKTLAAYAQLMEVVLANGTMPITIEPTKLPEGVAEAVHVDPTADKPTAEAPENPYGYPGDGRTTKPGFKLLGSLSNLFGDLEDKMKEGEGKVPSQITVHPAQYAAKKMEKTILDQLEETRAAIVVRQTGLELCALGTGAMKGPFTEKKEYARWNDDGVYEPVIVDRPRLAHVSIWNLYPDPSAKVIDEAEWVIEEHRLNATQMRALKKRPYFRDNAIDSALEDGPNGVARWFDSQLTDTSVDEDHLDYRVLEYWGNINPETAKEAGMTLPAYMMEEDTVQINAWVCGNHIIRLVLNPFKPARIPYCVCPYEMHPYQIWGVGVPENMEDLQLLMNGHVRMAIDNLALAGHVVFEVDEANLMPGEDLRIYPGKIFRRNGGPPGQSIFGTKFPSTAQENLAAFDKFRQMADDATGISSVSHGQTGVSGTGRTASGLSMLMGASSLNSKTVIKNMDDFFHRPVGEGFFHWNMQFNRDPDIKGDLEVRARGASSLMQKEVRSQRLMTLMQVAGNELFAPFIKVEVLLRELADTLDIDADKFLNSPSEAKLQAMIQGISSDGSRGNEQAVRGPKVRGGRVGGDGAGTTPEDTTGRGAGTIGSGAPSMPGEDNFSG